MAYEGHVRNGMIVLNEHVNLAEGVRVRVEVLHSPEAESLHPDILRITGLIPSHIDVREEHAQDMAKRRA